MQLNHRDIEKKSEFRMRFFVTKPQQAEYLLLHILAMNSN